MLIKNMDHARGLQWLLKDLKINLGLDFRASGFPEELIDNEKEEKGYEV